MPGDLLSAPLEGRTWELEWGVDVPIEGPSVRPTATFADGRIAGTSGCNRYTGACTVDGAALEFGAVATTRMACPPPADEVERAFLAALARVVRWRADGDRLALTDADGAELLRFAPPPPAASALG